MASATLANIVMPVVERLQFPLQFPAATIVVQPTTAGMSKWGNPLTFSQECSTVHHRKATQLVHQESKRFGPSQAAEQRTDRLHKPLTSLAERREPSGEGLINAA